MTRETRCAWLIPAEEPDARYMVPGCMTRVQDWDADCTCTSTAEELDAAEEKIAELEAAALSQQDRMCALISVVGRMPNARALLEEVDRTVREWAVQRDAVKAMASRADNQPERTQL